MAHGQIATGTAIGGTTGLAAGPFGAAAGAAVGYVTSSGLLRDLFGGKRQKTVVPWYKNLTILTLVGASGILLVLVILNVRRQ